MAFFIVCDKYGFAIKADNRNSIRLFTTEEKEENEKS
ncbi:MAG: hypothetical protein ACJASL_003502 [Paraglaciecola sp.]|jgi:hypothetical protein